MANAIATLCGTTTAVSSAALGLSFASTDPDDFTSSAPPPAPALHPHHPLQTPSPRLAHPHYPDQPLPAGPQSMLDSTSSTPTKSPPGSLRKRLSSFHDPFAPASTRNSDASHAVRPRPSRQSTSYSGTASYSSGRDDTVRSNAHSSSSAQPFISPGVITPPPAPNKLVKRSSSQRGPHTAPPSSFKRFHLKRPATSHQRSATWSMQNFEASRNQDLRPLVAYTDPRPVVKSKHFLQVRSVKQQRASHDHESFHIKQIRPSGSAPVLLPAGSVAAPEVVVVDELHDADLRKTPHVLSSPASSSPRRLSDDLQPPPKRLLQYNESLRRRAHTSSPQSKLMRKLSKRITSAPASHTQQSTMDQGHTPPQHRSPLDIASTGQSVSHGSESDASVPNTPTSLPYRLMQRRTRPSATSSDRTSSRPGSDGGPRVFSWAEGFDEDMNSDTVYDSIRTNTTTKSTPGAQSAALDTLFDQSTPSRSQNKLPVQSEASPGPTSTHAPLVEQVAPSTPVRQKPSVRVQPEPEVVKDSWSFSDEEDGFSHEHLGLARDLGADQGLGPSPRDTGLKNNLFDWSEQPVVEETGTPPRPKTAHPKKQLDPRAGLSAGRRAPSGLHSRSHSVPVLQDLVARQSDTTNKFGSWGIGSKGATEAWDNDFDFDESDFVHDNDEDATENNTSVADPKRLSGSMIVPDNIQKQQSNVLANISLLRDWGILIEELKELRVRATALGARTEETADVFDEVDAMVDLADQEVDDGVLPPIRSPASSQTLSEDGFDQVTPPRADSAQRARMSPSEMLRVMQRTKPARASPRVDSPEAFQRPRQDSEAAARSVIEALQRWRRPATDGTTTTPPNRTKKVPFDTATLRHIVPHVHGLMRKVKQIVREAEGLNTSPDKSIEEPEQSGAALRRAFEPQTTSGQESPGAQKAQRLQRKRAMSSKRGRGVEDEGEVWQEISGLTIDDEQQ